MDKSKFAFGQTNFILLAISAAIVVLGFILMGGDASSPEAYNPDIFSTRRIKVAPVVCFIGFVSMIFAVVYRKKEKTDLHELNKEL